MEHQTLASALYKNLCIYRIGVEEKVSVSRGRKSSSQPSDTRTLAGIGFTKDLTAFLSGELQVIPSAVVKRGDWNSTIMAVKPVFLETMRQIGFYSDTGQEPFKELDIKDPLTAHIKDPLTAQEKGEEVVFIEVHGAAHQIFDLDGLPLPVCLGFNYIDGGFAEDKYDLLKAVNILLKREDVTLALNGGERSYYYDGKESDSIDPKVYIGSIPGYNAERGRSQCLSFRWHPTTEDYRKVFALLEPRGHWGLRKACFDADIFGLGAGGATYFDSFHGHRRVEQEEEDNE